jgi:hypothetical protein
MKIAEIQNAQTIHNNTTNNDLVLERDCLLQENQLFKSAIDEWSKRFEEIRLENEQITKYDLHLLFHRYKFVLSSRQSLEKDEHIAELEKTNGTVRKSFITILIYLIIKKIH